MSFINRYEDHMTQVAYENACTCFYFGMGRSDWVHYDLPKEKQDEVWKVAFWDMAEGDNYTDQNRPTIEEIMAY